MRHHIVRAYATAIALACCIAAGSGQQAQSVAAQLTLTSEVASKGAPGARLALIEFADFECVYCEQYAVRVKPHLMRRYVERGLVRYVFKHFPLTQIHPMAMQAAVTAECARRQNRFWESHDRLFARAGPLTSAVLREVVDVHQLDKTAFERCASGAGPSAVSRDLAEGISLGVNGTPTVVLGVVGSDERVRVIHSFVGAQQFPVFEAAIEVALKMEPTLKF